MNVRTRTQPTEEAPGRERLTRDRIIETALRVMDDEGLEAVTMRRIGRELGVEAMSLYNHVEDKDDILEGVTERVMNEFEFPDSTGRWAEDARAMSREWRRLLALHPSVCQLLAERHKNDGLVVVAVNSRSGTSRWKASRPTGRWTPHSAYCVAPGSRIATPRRRSTPSGGTSSDS